MLASQSDTTSSWREDEWVCGDCVLQFIKRELYGWLARRQFRGQSVLLFAKANVLALIVRQDGRTQKDCWCASFSYYNNGKDNRAQW